MPFIVEELCECSLAQVRGGRGTWGAGGGGENMVSVWNLLNSHLSLIIEDPRCWSQCAVECCEGSLGTGKVRVGA